MVVPVEYDIQSRRASDQVDGTGMFPSIPIAQMRKSYHIIRSFSPGGINLSLGIFIECLRHKVIDIVPLFVLKGLGRCACRSGGGNKGHISNVHLAITENPISRKRQVIGTEVTEIGTDHRSIQGFRQPEHLRHAIVELMIAERNDIIAHLVHNLNNVLAMRNGTHHIALHEVATRNGGDIRRLHPLPFPQAD